MQINSVHQGHQDPLGLSKRLERAAEGGKSMIGAVVGATTSDAANGSNQAAAQIMSAYDVTNISPQQYSQMIQKLHDAGTLNDKDFRDLSLLRVDLDAAGTSASTPVNLLQFCSSQLSQTQQKLQAASQTNTDPATTSSLQQSADSMKQRLDWLQKLSLLHNPSGPVGVDATA